MGNKVFIFYDGSTIDDLRKDFEDGIDSYLKSCKVDEIYDLHACVAIFAAINGMSKSNFEN